MLIPLGLTAATSAMDAAIPKTKQKKSWIRHDYTDNLK